MKVETRFEIVEDLVGVQALLIGPTGRAVAQLIVDTGAVLTTVVPRVAESIGYSSADILAPSIKRSAGPSCRSAPGWACRAAGSRARGSGQLQC